jgi:hypothetical protein
LSSCITPIHLKGTVDGVAGHNPTANRWFIGWNLLNLNNLAGGAPGCGVYIEDGDTIMLVGNDIGYGTNSHGVRLGANCRKPRLFFNTFEYESQTAGFYPIEIDAGSALDLVQFGNNFTDGCQQPHIHDNNAVANRRWMQFDNDKNAEFLDGFAQFYNDLISWRGIHIRGTSGASAINFRRTTDAFNRLQINNNGFLSWIDPTDGSAGPSLGPRSTSGPVTLQFANESGVGLPLWSAAPGANASRVAFIAYVAPTGGNDGQLFFVRQKADLSYETVGLIASFFGTTNTWTVKQIHQATGGTVLETYGRSTESFERLQITAGGGIFYIDNGDGSTQGGWELRSTGAPLVVQGRDDFLWAIAKAVSTSMTGSTSRRGVILREEGAAGAVDSLRQFVQGQAGANVVAHLLPLTNAVSLNFPNVVAGSFQDLTISVTGAAVGDAVAPGYPAPGAGEDMLDYRMWVSAANTVTVRCFNRTGADINPAAATFRATVLRGF